MAGMKNKFYLYMPLRHYYEYQEVISCGIETARCFSPRECSMACQSVSWQVFDVHFYKKAPQPSWSVMRIKEIQVKTVRLNICNRYTISLSTNLSPKCSYS
jgi:hypothetical protein